MMNIKILWVDDEIEILKPHILFLESKHYEVHTATNGVDALEMLDKERFDVVFLDENMPGLSGLETLLQIKEKRSNLPVIMITKSEEENLMEEAIGNKITDYLIKPLNPKQILLSLKKNLDHTRLISEQTTSNYQQEFTKIAMEMMELSTYQDWIKFYKKLIYWELQLENVDDSGMQDILISQKKEANSQFFKFIKKNYKQLLEDDELIFSHTLFKKVVKPELSKQPILWVVLDNIRYDQFRVMEPVLNNMFRKVSEVDYFSILPTATQYARNAMFAGLMPSEMERLYAQYWRNDFEEGGKNLFEAEFLQSQLDRFRMDIKMEYFKITSLAYGKQLAETFQKTKQNDLTVVVMNFVDMLSHAKTEMEVIKELAGDDKAYRSLTLSWFNNSPLLDILKKAQQMGMRLVITTDHGTINTQNPTKLVGPKEISANLRYKTGKGLSYEEKDVFAVDNPEDIYLPQTGLNTSYVFAKEDLFFAYPNNYNHYVKYYRNTYQHGGISLEEMIIPCAVYEAK